MNTITIKDNIEQAKQSIFDEALLSRTRHIQKLENLNFLARCDIDIVFISKYIASIILMLCIAFIGTNKTILQHMTHKNIYTLSFAQACIWLLTTLHIIVFIVLIIKYKQYKKHINHHIKQQHIMKSYTPDDYYKYILYNKINCNALHNTTDFAFKQAMKNLYLMIELSSAEILNIKENTEEYYIEIQYAQSNGIVEEIQIDNYTTEISTQVTENHLRYENNRIIFTTPYKKG